MPVWHSQSCCGCATYAPQASAGSAYGGYDISVLELLNDGPSELAIICSLSVYDVGSADFLVAKGMISFARKWTAHWSLTQRLEDQSRLWPSGMTLTIQLQPVG